MSSPRLFTVLLVLSAAGWACGDHPSSPGGVDGPGGGPVTPPVTAPDGPSHPVPVPSRSLDVEPLCERVLPGASSSSAPEVALSAAHAEVRFFGPVASLTRADEVLARALDVAGPGGREAWTRYGAELGDVCVLEAAPTTFVVQAEVRLEGKTAVVRPGAGPLVLPAGAEAVALDLRELPEHDGLWAQLEAAASLALKGSVDTSPRFVRQHEGHTDQLQQNVFRTQRVRVEPGEPIPGSASSELPLAVITGERLAPTAARFAGELRLARRAWLIGHELQARVAELRWAAGPDVGLAFQAMDLATSGGQRWPDMLAADFAPDQLTSVLGALPGLGVPEQPSTSAQRPQLRELDVRSAPSSALTSGSARAALLIVHGTLRRFYPYLPVVGDTLDERLSEVLTAIDTEGPPERERNLELLYRLGAAIEDGHNFTNDISGEHSPLGVFPVLIDQVGGEPVIQASAVPEVKPGDTLVRIAGMPATEWYAREYPRTAGATPGYRFDLATRKYLELYGPTQFGVRSLDGTVRTVTVQPRPYDELLGLYALGRKPGFLASLGATDVFYMDLDGMRFDDAGFTCQQVLGQATGARALIVDLRGYPGNEAMDCLGRFARTRMMSPRWSIPTWTGPESRELVETPQWWVDPMGGPSFHGAIVLLVGPTTVSYAETVSTMLVDAKRLTAVFGRRSAGTNGNITYMRLPGGTVVSFTGLAVTHADGRTFHGIGIVPDVVVEPKATDFRDGYDRTLAEAVKALQLIQVN